MANAATPPRQSQGSNATMKSNDPSPIAAPSQARILQASPDSDQYGV